MQAVLKKLEKVQEIDSQIYNILKKKAEFPERLAGFEINIQTLTIKFDAKKKVVDELEKNKRQQMGALELNEDRSKRSQDKLEQIKTNQEFQAVQKELDSLKKNSDTIKENAQKASNEVGKFGDELKAVETELNDLKAKRDSESAKISAELQTIDADLKHLQAQRAEAVAGIDKRYLATYDRVRSGRNGMGLAPVSSGTCRGCNMRIPPQIYNELQRGTELFTCPSCRRILIYSDAPVGVVSQA